MEPGRQDTRQSVSKGCSQLNTQPRQVDDVAGFPYSGKTDPMPIGFLKQ